MRIPNQVPILPVAKHRTPSGYPLVLSGKALLTSKLRTIAPHIPWPRERYALTRNEIATICNTHSQPIIWLRHFK